MSIKTVINRFHRRALNYNLFIRDENDYHDDGDRTVDGMVLLRQQRYATRVYVFLFTSKYAGVFVLLTVCMIYLLQRPTLSLFSFRFYFVFHHVKKPSKSDSDYFKS